MKIVREYIFEELNENMQQAKVILKKAKLSVDDPRFQQIKQMLLADNTLGYIGKFTKWIIQDRETWDKLVEVYEMLKDHPTKVPAIDTFEKLEDLFDFLQGSSISNKVNKAIKAIEKRLIYFKISDISKLEKLIELNVKYVDQIVDFYNKKGRKFKNYNDLLKETENLINNLAGSFNLETMKKKIRDKKLNVQFAIERPDLLVIIPQDYTASHALGSSSWCISYSKNYWDSYADIFSNQYFIYDFSKPLSDKRSMIGATINPDGSFKASHFKDDSVASKEYLENLFSE